MKTNLSEKSMQQGSDSLALFSRISGVGVAGIISHPFLQEEEITVQESDTVHVEDETGGFCQNQQNCQKQLNCQPGKCQNTHPTIDLWFYLSSPA